MFQCFWEKATFKEEQKNSSSLESSGIIFQNKSRKCPVPNCSTRANRGFYRIPEHPKRRQDWLNACQLPLSTKDSTTVRDIQYRVLLKSRFVSILEFRGRVKKSTHAHTMMVEKVPPKIPLNWSNPRFYWGFNLPFAGH